MKDIEIIEDQDDIVSDDDIKLVDDENEENENEENENVEDDEDELDEENDADDEMPVQKKRPGRPRKEVKAKPSDKVKCEICDAVVTRSNMSKHKKSKFHRWVNESIEKYKRVVLSQDEESISVKELKERRIIRRILGVNDQ